MKGLFATATLVLSLSGASVALAQGTGATASPSGSPSAAPSSRVMSAPVGHRQPRVSDVPSAEEKNYMESPEDKALDRKIKSICRGC